MAVMENSYPSLSVAIQKLQAEGYTEDFNLCEAGVENKHKKTIHSSAELEVVRYYRFEGMSSAGDNTILYVIETPDGGKGLLVDAFGADSGNIPMDMIDKLRITR